MYETFDDYLNDQAIWTDKLRKQDFEFEQFSKPLKYLMDNYPDIMLYEDMLVERVRNRNKQFEL